ncbi:M23 family metallopeptidase [Tumebacillus sp. DT12]|uniref:M23 family metallopeptidase n=1 Tax=Tumebacillus lacus TaxID=2995335 RepID=A0ABT3X3D7_9BACL|nr:M23 family metallopeptidase [Tumebacillus lacus]MCX7571413.1 M23 family metallopeptidase [Tumebacillus lacus]
MIKWDFWKKKRRRGEYETMPWSQGFQNGGGFDAYSSDSTRSSLFAGGDDDWDATSSRPVFTPHPSSRGRSYEDFLRARGQSRQWDGPYGGRRFGYEDDEYHEEANPMRRAMQVLGAVALTGVLYFSFQSEQPVAQKVQAFVTSTMTSDSNFAALPEWWRDNVADRVAVPTMGTGGSSVEAPEPFVLPVQGTVKVPYDGKEQQGITFQTAAGANVKASRAGVIEKVEQVGAEDFTVTINHGTSGRTMYSHLKTVSVKAEDWVQSNEVIGVLKAKDDKSDLFFAFQRDGQYVDPDEILELPASGEASGQKTEKTGTDGQTSGQ